MKKYLFIAIVGSTLSLLGFNASADVFYSCTNGAQERTIAVVYDNPDRPVPCQVEYTKDGGVTVLWSAKHQENYCEQKAAEFVKKQEGWGWKCE